MATILSAQCTDERVNRVTPVLFRRYRTASDYAGADPAELEGIIRSTGFFRAKARNIIRCCSLIREKHAGKIPDTLEELVQLPGVWRKTANVILGNLFGKPAIVVDTHVKRVSQRLGLTRSDDPNRIEQDLGKILPPRRWTELSHHLLLHGRYVCTAKAPRCGECEIYPICPWREKTVYSREAKPARTARPVKRAAAKTAPRGPSR